MLSRHTKVYKVNDNVDLRQDCQLWIRCISENEICLTGIYTLLNWYVKLKSIVHKLFYRMFSSLYEAKNESYKAPVCWNILRYAALDTQSHTLS